MIWIYVIVLAIALIGIAVLLTSFIMFKVATDRDEKATPENLAKKLRRELEALGRSASADAIDENIKNFYRQNPESVYIYSRDGLKLHGYLITSKDADRTVVFSHGWKSNTIFDFSCIWKFYLDRNFNVLMIDHRSHGKSEGKYICFGIKERFDLIDWVKFVNSRFGDDKKVFLSGLSMGSTTVMMAIGEDELPNNVYGASCDCGYTSPMEEFKHVIRNSFHMPPFPILNIANKISKKIAGYSFDEYSTKTALSKAKIPVYFIHGESDVFVPISHTYENVNACASRCKLVTVKDAGHGLSYIYDKNAVTVGLLQILNEIFENE